MYINKPNDSLPLQSTINSNGLLAPSERTVNSGIDAKMRLENNKYLKARFLAGFLFDFTN